MDKGLLGVILGLARPSFNAARSLCRLSFAGIPAAKRFLAENDRDGSLCDNSGPSKAMTRLWLWIKRRAAQS
jgi:hypothetical protein